MSLEYFIVTCFVISGAFVLLVAAIGIIRLPDVYCRSHALGKGMTLGISLLLIGLWIHLGFEHAGIKVPLAILFQFITIPVASHLLSNLSHRIGIPQFEGTRERPAETKTNRSINQ